VKQVVAGFVAFLLASVVASAFIRWINPGAWALGAYFIGGGVLWAAIYGWLIDPSSRRPQGGRRGGAHADLLAQLGPHTTGVGCTSAKRAREGGAG
jgi:hypothetical protein